MSRNHNIPIDLLNDLSSRFIINVPEEERVDLIRVCFQIELAHWFYLDFYCEEDARLPKCTLKDFIRIIFGHIPFLQKYYAEVDSVIAEWREYKKAVPTFGAILLDEELKYVILVQSYVAKASWGFPKGKVNKDEQSHHCAIREVFEETGFDISSLIDPKAYLEHYFNDQLIRLYIISGIPRSAKFHPKTRKEIKNIQWFPVNLLPTSKKDHASKGCLEPNNLFVVIPFVKPLKKWIAAKLANMTEKADHPTPNSDKLELTENDIPTQQQLLNHLFKNDLTKHSESKDNAHSIDKINRPTYGKPIYSPPPRMLRQRNLKQAAESEKKKNMLSYSHTDERMGLHPKHSKKILEFQKDGELQKEQSHSLAVKENVFNPTSETWANFSLDCEALVATFNINLRKAFLTSSSISS